MLGDENKGFSQVMRGFDFSRALMGLQIDDGTVQIMKLIIVRGNVGRVAVHYAT